MCLCICVCLTVGNTEDKKVPTVVQAFADHKMVGVDCGSGDAHTLFLEDNGECVTIKNLYLYTNNVYIQCVHRHRHRHTHTHTLV